MINLIINRGHNSSCALFENDNLIFHMENERLSNIKYDALPFLSILEIKKYTDKIDNLIIIGMSEMNKSFESYISGDVYSNFVQGLGKSFYENSFNTYFTQNNHHLFHAACSFYNSGFNNAVCIVKDGGGSAFDLNGKEIGCSDFLNKNIKYGRETSSFYLTKNKFDFSLLEKTVSTPFKIKNTFNNNKNIIFTNFPGDGFLFEEISKMFGFHVLDGGKVMGMSCYGNKNMNIYVDDSMNNEIFSFKYNYDNNNVFMEIDKEKLYNDFDKNFKTDSNIAYSLQSGMEKKIIKEIKNIIDKTNTKNICLSGGVFLNCVANYKILKSLPKDINIYIEPISNDAGTTIGAGYLFYYEFLKNQNKTKEFINKKQNNIYYGVNREYSKSEILSKLEIFNVVKETSNRYIAEIISNKKIVAIFQGRSESGPRALGNRSILYDPRDPEAKNKVNIVKKREWFRPFAGSILEEDAKQWFEMHTLEHSPFMMYAIPIKKEKENIVPGIIHVDKTCRIQTVSEKQNKNFYNLIKEFKNITGVPIVFNTSFNIAGNCIVETLEDAIKTLNSSEIDYLFLPEHNLLIS
jgi:carbamoyltransferase